MHFAVLSGKGGTGKTLVATSMALSCSHCTYVDLDVEEPNGFIFMQPNVEDETSFNVQVPQLDETKCTFCGTCTRACQFNAITLFPKLKNFMFFPELCHSCGACTYFCPVQGALTEVPREVGMVKTGFSGNNGFIEGRMNIGQPSSVPLIHGIIDRYLQGNDLYILDSPPGTSCPVVEIIRNCDYILLVAEPTPFGASDLELTLQIAKDFGKLERTGLVINKDTPDSRLIDDMAAAYDVPIHLRIPFSLEIQKNYARGVPLTTAFPKYKDEFRQMIETLTTRVKSQPKSTT